MKRISSVLFGTVLIFISAVLILNALEITSINIFFDGWWTMIIIIPSLIGLLSCRDKTVNIIGLLVGVFLFLVCRDIINSDILWKLMVPVIIAVIGIKMIFGATVSKGEFVKFVETNGNNLKTAFAAFSGQSINFDNEIFKGAELTALFGGIKCDLRNAVFEGDVVINACSIFGGMDILLPENINIKINSNSIFGGVENKNHQNLMDNQCTVYLNGTCIFGGVDVK